MLEQMCAELESKFRCRFKIKDTEGLIEIVCNDRDIEDNEEAIEEIIEIGSKYLEESRLWDIGVVYDYLGELPCKEISKVFSQEKSMIQATDYADVKIYNYMNKLIQEKEFKMVPKNESGSSKNIIVDFKEKVKYKIEKLITNLIEDKNEENCRLDFDNIYKMCL